MYFRNLNIFLNKIILHFYFHLNIIKQEMYGKILNNLSFEKFVFSNTKLKGLFLNKLKY